MNDWFGAAKKSVLSHANKLLLDMQEYDKDHIPDKVIAVSITQQTRNNPKYMPLCMLLGGQNASVSQSIFARIGI